MAIDPCSRRDAIGIYNGEVISDPSPKSELYGLLARCLTLEQLDSLKVPAVPLSRPLSSFQELGKHLEVAIQESVCGSSGSEQRNNDQLQLLLRARQPYLEISPDPASTRLTDGAHTAAKITEITLRTYKKVSYETYHPVTREGLTQGRKVLFGIAMLHIHTLADQSLFEYYCHEGDGGDVINSRLTAYTENDGLRLRSKELKAEEKEWLGAIAWSQTNHPEPQIGCPATMVKGFLDRIWEVASTAAVEAKLIEVRN